jgi:hypothetical protein
MADVIDGVSHDSIRLSFAASRLGAMIRKFEHSYRLRNFVEGV